METNFFRYAWRHSRRDQVLALTLVAGSLPFYWWSLEIPKSIVNDAIQGRAFSADRPEALFLHLAFSLPGFLGGHSFVLFDGLMLEQMPFLFGMSFLFLALVLVNGAFKYVINIQKGVLGERMLRRLRFDLFTRILQFEPEDIRATKSAEVTSMIKDEVEPIGGFFGEAFITPMFLGAQAITALAFIIVQNAWLGMIAFAVIAVQAFVIPRLRREQIRLGRERQIASRRLAGRIGEMIDAAPAIHIYGVGAFNRAEVGDRLAELFNIRLLLYRRKFAVKYLNNLLAQVTPFVFYTIGGYLALRGRLDIGQLVAIIAAYRDLPNPIKELIDWDQMRADVTVKYEQVVSQFSRDTLIPADAADPAAVEISPVAPFTLIGLQVSDRRGVVQLERLSATIRRPAHIALVGGAGGGRDILPKVLGRQIADFQGGAMIGDLNIGALPDNVASRFMTYVGGDPHILSGTIRDNICLALQRRIPEPDEPADRDAEQRLREARQTGNPVELSGADWIDYASVGATGPGDIDQAIARGLKIAHGYDDIFRLGISGRLGTDVPPEVAERLVAARGLIRERLAAEGLADLVEQFEPDRFNMSAPIGENLVFGMPTGDRVGAAGLAKIPYFRAILEAESLIAPLTAIGMKMAETVIEVFAGLAPGHPLFERYSFIGAAEIEELARALEGTRQKSGSRRLPLDLRDRLIGFALAYVEPRHRLDVIDESLKRRILRARVSFRKFLPGAYASGIEFYNPDRIMGSASISDNLLFGRINFGAASAREQVAQVLDEVIRDQDLESFILQQALGYEAGPGGRLLSAQLRMTINLVRAILRRPEVLILDSAFSAFAPYQADQMLASIRREMQGRTVIVSLPDQSPVEDFDRVLVFEGAKLTKDRVQPAKEAEIVKAADLANVPGAVGYAEAER